MSFHLLKICQWLCILHRMQYKVLTMAPKPYVIYPLLPVWPFLFLSPPRQARAPSTLAALQSLQHAIPQGSLFEVSLCLKVCSFPGVSLVSTLTFT